MGAVCPEWTMGTVYLDVSWVQAVSVLPGRLIHALF